MNGTAPARRTLLTVGLGALVGACVTVNIYFPAAQVENTAEEIVEEVYGEEGAPPESLRAPDAPPSRSWRIGLGPPEAHAEEAATTVSNATIRAVKDEIAGRHEQLLPHYRAGRIGIDREGYLDVRTTEGLGLAQVGQLKRLVEADNRARRRLYEEVARALDLQADQVERVQEIFAGTWRDKARPGWLVQSDRGEWHRK